MKRLHLRLKTLLRALRVAAFAFVCWIGAQRAAQAQTVLGPGSYPGFNSASGNYALDSATFLSTSSTGFAGYTSPATYSSPHATFNLGGGSLTIDSASSISYQYPATASGVYAAALTLGSAGNATVDNFGTISGSENSSGAVGGVDFNSTTGSSLNFTNHSGATISGVNANAVAYGLDATTNGSGQITINNNGSGLISGSGVNGNVFGIIALGVSGQITVNNTGSGSILGSSASNYSASGIYVESAFGQITINNTGTGSISSSAAVRSFGIYVNSTGPIVITNSGTITASNTSGISSGIYQNLTSSSILITNSGTIVASSGSGSSYGIYLSAPGTIYNTGSITADTAAIRTPNGSLVTLAGTGAVNGLILGGNSGDHGAASTLDFDLTVRSNYTATKSALDAAIAADLYATQAVSIVINGVTYTFEYFGTVADGLVQGVTYSQVPGYGSLGASLDNLATSTNPNAVTLLNALSTLSAANLPAALAQLSPAKTSQQFLTQPVTQATFQNLELGQRLALVRSGLAGGADWSGLQFVDAQDPLLSQIKSQLYAYNPVSTPGEVSDTAAPLSSGDQFARWGTFLTGNAVLTNQSATANQNHADSTTVDITAGADYHLNRNWAVGFLFGYGRTNASVDDNGSRVGDDQYRFGPYVGYSQGPWFANASTDFAFNEESSKRAIGFLGQEADAHPSGTQYGAEADGGYEFKALDNKLVYGPTASLQYTHLDVDSYTETGSVADLSVASQHEDSLQGGLGGKASYDAKWSWNGATIRPDIHGSWLHEFMANNDTVNAAFDIPGAQSFSTTFQKQQRDSGLVGCGVQNIFKGGSLLFVNYDAQVGVDNYLAQSISGGVKIVF